MPDALLVEIAERWEELGPVEPPVLPTQPTPEVNAPDPSAKLCPCGQALRSYRVRCEDCHLNAAFPEVVRSPVQEEDRRIKRQCAWCKNLFYPRGTRLTCSDPCREKTRGKRPQPKPASIPLIPGQAERLATLMQQMAAGRMTASTEIVTCSENEPDNG